VGVTLSKELGAEPISAAVQGVLNRLLRRGDRVTVEDGTTEVVTAVAKHRVMALRIRLPAPKVIEERNSTRDKTSIPPADKRKGERLSGWAGGVAWASRAYYLDESGMKTYCISRTSMSPAKSAVTRTRTFSATGINEPCAAVNMVALTAC
jgi:hypothetical protein